jgi:hypothetical protein
MKVLSSTLGARFVGLFVLAAGACGGGSPQQTGNRNGVTTTNATVAACDHYFAAQYLRCGGPRLPDGEIARIRTRFEGSCANQIALPGSGMSAETVEACAASLDMAACQLPGGPPAACQFQGSLGDGAACTDDVQCSSGNCDDGVEISPEGPVGPPKCGHCKGGAVAAGEVCAHENFSAGCPSGSICLVTDASAMLPTYVCTAVTVGDVGAACDDLAATCTSGLYCAGGHCAQLGAAGAPCGEGASSGGNPGGCAAPLGCVDSSGGKICASGDSGAACRDDFDCSAGLGCVPVAPCAMSGEPARIGCSTSGQCVPVTWAEPGQSCTLAVRCRVGSCLFPGGFAPMVQNMDGSLATGVCPMVISDGAPCGAGTCDTFSACFDGKCGPIDGVVCK